MSTLVSLLGRKPVSATAKPAPAQQPAAAPGPVQQPAHAAAPERAARTAADKADIELDHELFSPIAVQLGQENEAVRNLLLDAEHKIGELEIIKRSIGKLVDPVSKTLRAYEETKSEKLSLQGTLNTTRLAYNKLREDFEAAQKKTRTLETDGARLRDMVAVAQQSVAALERSKGEQIAELNARRNHIAELQRLAQQQGSDLQLSGEENRRLSERIAGADKRAVQLEGQVHAAQQKAMQADRERAAVQASLDKALAELAQTARRLTETDKMLTMTQSRLKTVESGLAEAQQERTRLSAALDEASSAHLEEMNVQNSRFDALQARYSLTEHLLEEARQTLMARADEIRTFERRVDETSTAQGNAGERLDQVTATLAERERQIKDLEQAHSVLSEQNRMLANAVAARESAHSYAQEKVREQTDLVQLLEGQLKATRDGNAMQVEQLQAQLQREQLERSMAEGALESGRKDIARLMREIGALRYQPLTPAAAEAPWPPHPDLRAA
jgi:chromosome segregation ATPase